MFKRPRLKRSARYTPPRGTKLKRKQKFEPRLATDSGIHVRSGYEQICADFLFKQNIEFQYEPLMLLGGRKYRPDFYLPAHSIFIEICGYGHMPFYNERVKHKMHVYEKHKLNVIFIHHNGSGSLAQKLEKVLIDAKIL
jgi:hypothetical protein